MHGNQRTHNPEHEKIATAEQAMGEYIKMTRIYNITILGKKR